MIKNITSAKEFLEETQTSTVVVDFFSKTCNPCKLLAMQLDMLEEEYGDKIKVLKVDALEVEDLANDFNVVSVPTVFKLVDGEVVDMFTGARPKDFFVEWLGL
jgi:thioredoxin 1